MRIGKNVKEMERLVAAAFAKKRGIMVNSGSSALYLAVELLGLAVCKIRPSVHAAYQARRDPLPVSLGAVYAKLGGVTRSQAILYAIRAGLVDPHLPAD